MLCKHEVVGSIPSGSTRWFDHRLIVHLNRPRNITSHLLVRMDSKLRDFLHRKEEIDPSWIGQQAIVARYFIISGSFRRSCAFQCSSQGCV